MWRRELRVYCPNDQIHTIHTSTHNNNLRIYGLWVDGGWEMGKRVCVCVMYVVWIRVDLTFCKMFWMTSTDVRCWVVEFGANLTSDARACRETVWHFAVVSYISISAFDMCWTPWNVCVLLLLSPPSLLLLLLLLLCHNPAKPAFKAKPKVSISFQCSKYNAINRFFIECKIKFKCLGLFLTALCLCASANEMKCILHRFRFGRKEPAASYKSDNRRTRLNGYPLLRLFPLFEKKNLFVA